MVLAFPKYNNISILSHMNTKIPIWKKWLSYIAEIHLESASSEYNPYLYVSLQKGRYQLSTKGAVYSYADLYDNFLKAFHKIDLNQLPGNEVLILGLGLGSIPFMLEKIFFQNYYYTAVEIDETVVDLANRYTLCSLRSNVEVIVADAYAFVMQTEQRFDLICMDVFIDDKIPSPFEALDFLEALRDTLTPGGILLYNRLTSRTLDKEKSNNFYKREFLQVFPNGRKLDVQGNWILLNDKGILRT